MITGSRGRGRSPVLPALWAARKGVTSRPTAVDVAGVNLASFQLGVAFFASCVFHRCARTAAQAGEG